MIVELILCVLEAVAIGSVPIKTSQTIQRAESTTQLDIPADYDCSPEYEVWQAYCRFRCVGVEQRDTNGDCREDWRSNECTEAKELNKERCRYKCASGYQRTPRGNCQIKCPKGQEIFEGECFKACLPGKELTFNIDKLVCRKICPSGKEVFGDECLDLCTPPLERNIEGNCGDKCHEGERFLFECHKQCPNGTERIYDSKATCMPKCSAGQEYFKNNCVRKCESGRRRSRVSGSCLVSCLEGEELHNGQCYRKCADGYERNPTGYCQRICFEGQDPFEGECFNACLPGEQITFIADEPICRKKCPEGKEVFSNDCVDICQPPLERNSRGLCEAQCKHGEERFNYVCLQRCSNGTERIEDSVGTCLPKCSRGQDRFKNKCVDKCQTGRKRSRINGACFVDWGGVPVMNPPLQHTEYFAPKCPEGFERRDGVCERTCEEGYERGRVLSSGLRLCQKVCPIGQEPFDGECFEICPRGYEINDGVCKKKCPEGQEEIFAGQCSDIPVENCPKGEERYRYKCRKICPNRLERINDTFGTCMPLCPYGQERFKNKCLDKCPQNYKRSRLNGTCFIDRGGSHFYKVPKQKVIRLIPNTSKTPDC